MTDSRPYAGHDDLILMQELAGTCLHADGELAHPTPGDLAWWMYQHESKLDEVRVQLWEDGRGLAAWAWAWLPGVLFVQVRPDARRPALARDVLAWFEKAVPGEDGAVLASALDRDEWLTQLLRESGYAETDDDRMDHRVRPLDALPEPAAADGYLLRHVSLPRDLDARVEVHRAAFAPSRVTAASYGVLARTAPYRPELDWVVEAPDGSFAAFCLVWLDEPTGVAEMEPVGTHPAHRRRGLARAVCLAALAAARGAGAKTGLVYANTGSDASRLYEGLGFAKVGEHVQFRKPR